MVGQCITLFLVVSGALSAGYPDPLFVMSSVPTPPIDLTFLDAKDIIHLK